MFDLKRLTLMFFLSALASGASATLTLPSADSAWSLDSEMGGIPLPLEIPKASTIDDFPAEGQALSQYEYDESRYQLICLNTIDRKSVV